MKPGADADPALIAHMRECLSLIAEYTAHDRARFDSSRMVQDAVTRNLQTLTESSQRLSDSIKATEPQVPWRELAGFRNVAPGRRPALASEPGSAWSKRRSQAAG